jgi:hypothetical protein
LGGLLKGEPFAGTQQQAGAIARGELRQGRAHRLTLGAPRRQVGRGVRPAPLVARREREPRQAAATPQRIEGSVSGDTVEPDGL